MEEHIRGSFCQGCDVCYHCGASTGVTTIHRCDHCHEQVKESNLYRIEYDYLCRSCAFDRIFGKWLQKDGQVDVDKVVQCLTNMGIDPEDYVDEEVTQDLVMDYDIDPTEFLEYVKKHI